MTFKEIILELSAREVSQCEKETRKEYPRIKELIFWHLTYMVHTRSDGTGWIKIPAGKVE